MPAIVIPRRQLVQPQGLSGINPDIPPPSLVFSGGQIYRGEQPVSNAAETAAGRGGRGVRNGAVVYTANADRYLSTTGGTALVVLSRDGAAQASTAFAFGTYNDATYRFSAHLTWSDGNIYFDFGGTFAPNRVVATAQTIDSTPTAIVLTAGPGGMRIFRDGRLIASSSTAPTRGNPTGCFFGLGLDPTSGATPTPQVDTGATYYAQAFWPEQINDRIAERLSADPWGLFKAPPRRLCFSLPAAPGGDITGTISAAESGTDVCTAVGVVRVSGAIASAESVADAASSAGEVLVSGVVAVAEVGVDHASLSGAIMVAGDLSAVEQGADQAALVGSVLISGSFAAFEIGSDAASMSGQVLVSGDVSASESTVDAASLAGSVEVSGVLAAIESGQDTAVITGGGVVSPVVGIVAAVESGADVAALAGTVLVSGVTAASESESDQAGISGAVHVSGSVSAAEGQLDTAHVMGRVLVSGVIASTEAANDSASVNGSSTTITSGVIAAAEAGADAAFIPGAVFVSGNAAAFEQGADIVVAAGVVRITGAMAANEVGTDTATIRSLPRDMTPRAGYIAGAALQRTYIAGAALQRRYVA